MSEKSKERCLRLLPAVDDVLKDNRVSELLAMHPRSIVIEAIRTALAEERKNILSGNIMLNREDKEAVYLDLIAIKTLNTVNRLTRFNLRSVINATGVVLHTNMGRAVLSEQARQAVNRVASGYSNLELNLDTGRRGSRYDLLEPLLVSLTGAEAALVVNNNAAAVLLALSTLAKGREVIVSRGQLVEIGGSFRIPEVMAQSGAHLIEVGATNKTHPEDYRRSVNENTSLLLQVHTSNYRIVGFTRETTVAELVEIGHEFSIPVMCDLGSGFLVDLSRYNLPWEPTVQEVFRAGPDIVTFSGDKLLGGPQAGIIVGKREYIEKMKNNPLTRAVRIDKMTVAALEATLREYLDEEQAIKDIPTLRMLTVQLDILEKKASKLALLLGEILGNKAEVYVEKGVSTVGGGAMPTTNLPTVVVAILPKSISAGKIQAALRQGDPAVIGRVQEDRLLLDVRTVSDAQHRPLAEAVVKAFSTFK